MTISGTLTPRSPLQRELERGGPDLGLGLPPIRCRVVVVFKGKPIQYPNLTSYLRHQEARGNDEPRKLARLGLGAVLIGLVISLIAITPFWGILIAIAIPLLVAMEKQRRMREGPTAEERLKATAASAGKTMLRCLDKRRLHRDLDAGSLVLLEESAACWIRIHNTLTSPTWSARDLPDSYRHLREQSIEAAEMAMAEMLILFKPYLPNEVKPRPVGDYVEEAIEGFVFNGVRVPDLPSPAFTPARQVADKLRDLAREIDEIGLGDLMSSPLLKPRAEAALDQCLSDLQAINKAERELRQDLNA